jgi:hypothetical protein
MLAMTVGNERAEVDSESDDECIMHRQLHGAESVSLHQKANSMDHLKMFYHRYLVTITRGFSG